MKSQISDYRQLFEALPGLYLILSSELYIIGVNDAYAKTTMTKREEIIGRHLFEVFPDNPDDVTADGVSKLKASLDYVRKHKKAHTMAVQKYDIRRPDGSFEERYWSPVNTPLLNDQEEVIAIIHKVEDVTEFVSMQQKQANNEKFTKGLQRKVSEMETEIIARSKEIEQMNTELEQKIEERTEEIAKKEQLFTTLMEHNYDAITLNDEQGIPLYQSPSTERILGWTLEERKRAEKLKFIHPDDREHVQKTLQEVAKNKGKTIYSSHRFRHKKGHYIWLEGVITNQLHVPGLEVVVSNFRDITERKKNEEHIHLLNEELEQKVKERTTQLEAKILQLKESETKFEKAFQASPASITITRTKDSSFVDVNDAFVKMIGLKKEKIIGKTSSDLGLVVDYDKIQETRQQLQEGKRTFKNLEMAVTNRYGVTHQLLASIVIIEMNGEECALSISYDITERIEAEKQLAAVNRELEAFSYSISHDLRAPLRAINGYAEMLLEDYAEKLDDEADRLLGNIKYYAQKMGILIDDLLSFSRLGRKDLQLVNIDSNELIEGVLMDISKSITHRAKIKIGKLHPIEADYGLMHQVLFNLLSNAIKYSSRKENPLIEISSEKNDQKIIFTVKDNGAGFDMKYIDKLFGVFQRLHTQEEFEGTGVGLAIVQRIINKHNGAIWAEAQPRVGATFYFSIPNTKES